MQRAAARRIGAHPARAAVHLRSADSHRARLGRRGHARRSDDRRSRARARRGGGRRKSAGALAARGRREPRGRGNLSRRRLARRRRVSRRVRRAFVDNQFLGHPYTLTAEGYQNPLGDEWLVDADASVLHRPAALCVARARGCDRRLRAVRERHQLEPRDSGLAQLFRRRRHRAHRAAGTTESCSARRSRATTSVRRRRRCSSRAGLRARHRDRNSSIGSCRIASRARTFCGACATSGSRASRGSTR